MAQQYSYSSYVYNNCAKDLVMEVKDMIDPFRINPKVKYDHDLLFESVQNLLKQTLCDTHKVLTQIGCDQIYLSEAAHREGVEGEFPSTQIKIPNLMSSPADLPDNPKFSIMFVTEYKYQVDAGRSITYYPGDVISNIISFGMEAFGRDTQEYDEREKKKYVDQKILRVSFTNDRERREISVPEFKPDGTRVFSFRLVESELHSGFFGDLREDYVSFFPRHLSSEKEKQMVQRLLQEVYWGFQAKRLDSLLTPELGSVFHDTETSPDAGHVGERGVIDLRLMPVRSQIERQCPLKLMKNKRIMYGAVIRHNEKETEHYHKLERPIYPLERVGFAVLFDKEYYAHGAFNEIWRRDDDVSMFQCTDLKQMLHPDGGDVVGFFDFPEFPSLKQLSSILEVHESYMQIIDKNLYSGATKQALISRLKKTIGDTVDGVENMKLKDICRLAYNAKIKVEKEFKIRQRQYDKVSYRMLLEANPLFTADFFKGVISEKAMRYLKIYEENFKEVQTEYSSKFTFLRRQSLDQDALNQMIVSSSTEHNGPFNSAQLQELRAFAKKIDAEKFESYRDIFYPSLIAHLDARAGVRNYHLDLVSYIYRLISMYFSKIGDFSIELVKRFVSEESRDLKLSVEFSEASRIVTCYENFKSTLRACPPPIHPSTCIREGIQKNLFPLSPDESKKLGKRLSELTLQTDKYTPLFIVINAAAVAEDAAKKAAAAVRRSSTARDAAAVRRSSTARDAAAAAARAADAAARTDVAHELRTADFCLDMDRYLTLRKDCPCCYDEIRLNGRYNGEFHGTCCDHSENPKKGQLILPQCRYGDGYSTLIEQMNTNPYDFMFLCSGSQMYRHEIQEGDIVIPRKLSGEGWPSSTAFGKVVNIPNGKRIIIKIKGRERHIDRELIAPAPRYKPFHSLEGIRAYAVATQVGHPSGLPDGREILASLSIGPLTGELQKGQTQDQAQAVDVEHGTVLGVGAESSIGGAPLRDEQLGDELDAVFSKEEKRRKAREQKKLQKRAPILEVKHHPRSPPPGGGGGAGLSGGGIKKERNTNRNTKKKRNIKNKRSMKKEKYTRKRIYKL